MRGRKPKPTAMKLVAGNPGKRDLPADIGLNTPELGDPPDWFPDGAKDAWREGAANAPRGVLTALDRSVFGSWALAVHRLQRAVEMIEREGEVIENDKGNSQSHPANGIAHRNADIIRQCAAALGFDPTSRSRIGIEPHKPQNPFGALGKPKLVKGGKA